jgi:hypothetical protein
MTICKAIFRPQWSSFSSPFWPGRRSIALWTVDFRQKLLDIGGPLGQYAKDHGRRICASFLALGLRVIRPSGVRAQGGRALSDHDGSASPLGFSCLSSPGCLGEYTQRLDSSFLNSDEPEEISEDASAE